MPDRKGTFYSPWPVIDGKPLNLQWGEIRFNQAELKALARNSFQELGTGDELNALRALLGQTYGDLVNNDRYRLLYDKVTQEFCVQRNDAFTDPPTWVDVWCIRPSDGQFQVTSEGGIQSSAGFYGPGLKEIQLVADSRDLGTPTDDDVTIECTDRILFDRCSGLKVRRIDCGAHKGAPEVTFTAPFGRSQIFNASGEEWVIPHNFGAGPQLVQVMDADDRVIIPDKADVSDPNTAYFYFHDTVVGSVIIATGGLGAVALQPKDPFYLVVRTEDKPAAGATLRPNAELIFDSEFFYVNANEDVAGCRTNPDAFISLNSEIFYLDELKDVTVTHPVTQGHVLMWEEQCSAFIPQEPKAGALYLNDLKDVEAENPSGGDGIQYNAATGFWETTAGIRSGFLHTQGAASVEWIVSHGQNSELVIAQVYDTSDRQIFPDVQDVSDPDIAYFYFTEAVAGKVFVIPTGPTGLANDHGSLSGLADDDHTQYLLIDGSRSMAGDLDLGDNNLQNLGIVEGDLHVGGDVTAEAFYLTPGSGGEISKEGNNLLIKARDGDVHIPNKVRIEDQVVAEAFYFITGGEVVSGVSDHGALTGLADDDHTQYSLVDGTRAYTGTLQGNLGVDQAVKAEAFYVASGVGVNAGCELNEFGIVAPDGDATNCGFRMAGFDNNEGLTVSGLNWQFRRGGSAIFSMALQSVTAHKIFNLTDGSETGPSFRFNSERMGMYKAGTSLAGFAVDDKRQLTIGKDGLNVRARSKAGGFYLNPGAQGFGRSLNIDNIPFHVRVGDVDSYMLDNFVPQPYIISEITIRCETGQGIVGFYIIPKGDAFFGSQIPETSDFYIGPIDRILKLEQNVNAGDSVLLSIFDKEPSPALTHVRGSLKIKLSG